LDSKDFKKMKALSWLLFPFLLVVSLGVSSCRSTETLPPIKSQYDPQQGYIPDSRTAIAVAEAVWTPFYGRELVEAERPFSAILQDGIWLVKGTLPKNMSGGTLIVRIAKKDGRIISMLHGQ
jgi:NTF2 fold immunity protein of polymorphic toxin system component